MSSNALVPRDLSLTNLAVSNEITVRKITGGTVSANKVNSTDISTNTLTAVGIATNDIVTDTLTTQEVKSTDITTDTLTTQEVKSTDITTDTLTANGVAIFNEGTIITSTGNVTPTVPLSYYNSQTFTNKTVTYGGGTTTANFVFTRIGNNVTINFYGTGGGSASIPLNGANNTSAASVAFAFGSSSPYYIGRGVSTFAWIFPIFVANNGTPNIGILILDWTSPINLSMFFYPDTNIGINFNSSALIGAGSVQYTII
jgi:hypothetical protein